MSLATCTTRVRVTIEINGSGPYGMDWTLKDLSEQSLKETISDLRSRFARERIVIIGEPEVIATIWKKAE